MDQSIRSYSLCNRDMMVVLTNIGASVLAIKTPDAKGKIDDIVLGYESIQSYCQNPQYFGCIAGRYANRIANAQFQLNGVTYKLNANDGKNHLHGGPSGLHRAIWDCCEYCSDKAAFRYYSPDMEEGYPGNLEIIVTYCLRDDNALEIQYFASSDKDTILNLTNHSYFNLAGHNAGSIDTHTLQLFADHYTPVKEDLIPTGEIRALAETPFDFRQPKQIGKHIGEDDLQLKIGKGYDHNFILRGNGLRKAAEVFEPLSGRRMEVYTTKPAIQFYSGNFLNNVSGKDDASYGFRSGFCLETQFSPDSPNHPGFDNAVLKEGEIYQHKTIYQFL